MSENFYYMILVNLVIFFSLLISFVLFNIFYPSRKIPPLIIIPIISLLPLVNLLRPGTYASGDLSLHASYLMSFYENLKQGVLIPEWGGKLCYGYGCPTFIFEYNLPFYIASFFHFIGFSF